MNRLTICNSIISGICELLENKSFMTSHRVENHFVRTRKLSMYQIVLYLIFTSKASLFQNIAAIRDELPVLSFPKVSKQAVSKARQGILSSLFEKLFLFSSKTYYDAIPSRKNWNGFHVFAIDGTRIQIPDTKKNLIEFGDYHNSMNPDKHWSLSLGSTIYDVLEDIIVHASIHKGNYSERKAALSHLEALEAMNLHKNSVIIFDRGYYSQEVYRYFVAKGYYCLMRMSRGIKFATRQTSNDVITPLVGLSKKGQKTIPIRVISVILDTGEIEYLTTNIMDDTITPDMFKELYFKRWPIESKYYEIKNQLLLEEFSGYTGISIRQEFFISLLFSNLSAIVKSEADSRINESKKASNKSNYQSNKAFIIGRLKKMIPKLLCGQLSVYTMSDLFEDAYRNRSQILPNRKYERKESRNQPKRKHYRNKKIAI